MNSGQQEVDGIKTEVPTPEQSSVRMDGLVGTSSGNTCSPMLKFDDNLLRTMRQELCEGLLRVRPCESPDEMGKRAHRIELGITRSVLENASEDNVKDLIRELETDDVYRFANPA